MKARAVILAALMVVGGSACSSNGSESLTEPPEDKPTSQGYDGPTGTSVFVSELERQYPDNPLNNYSVDIRETWAQNVCDQMDAGVNPQEISFRESMDGSMHMSQFEAEVGVTFAAVFVCREHRSSVD